MKRILITEDDLLIAGIYQEKFSQSGFQVTLAHDGRAAIELLMNDPPDVVLLDLMLPEVDGIEVLRFIRANPSLAGLPVVVLSNSKHFSSLAQTAWEAGATCFLNKADTGPVRLFDTVAKLLTSLEGSRVVPSGGLLPPENSPSMTLRVLVADDDPIIHSVLGFFITQSGHTILSAFNGREAIAIAEATPPDIMILDGMMPELDGFQVLSYCHERPHLARIPVIMVTATRGDEGRFKAFNAGALKFIIKPFSPDTLMALVRRYAIKYPTALADQSNS